MKKRCIFIIFLLILISSANGLKPIVSQSNLIHHDIFGVDRQSLSIFSYPLNSQSKTPMRPGRMHNIPGVNITRIAITPNGRYLYGIPESINNTIYLCHIGVRTSNLEHCQPNEVTIDHPQLITIHISGRFMYIWNNIGSIYHCLIDQETGAIHNCMETGHGFFGLTSIAISPQTDYIYLTYGASSNVTICRINRDFTFRDCTPNSDELYRSPRYVTVDPRGIYVYITDPDKIYPIICKPSHDTPTFSSCLRGDDMTNGWGSAPGSITTSPDGHYVYIVLGEANSIYTCAVNYLQDTFTGCALFDTVRRGIEVIQERAGFRQVGVEIHTPSSLAFH